MKINIFITLLLLLSFTGVFGQKGDAIPFMKKSDVNLQDTSKTKYNKPIGDGFIGFGFVLGTSNKGAKVNYGESREFIVGAGGGYRFFKWNGLGLDIYYKSTGFYLAQDSGKVLPDSILHKSEKISFDNFGGLVYDRFYIGPVFLDGGFYFDWTFYTKHITWDNYSFSYGNTTKVIEKQLKFTNTSNYGLTFRIGQTDGVSLYFNYRLSNLFKATSPQSTPYPELPVYVLGIVVGGH